ncbi:MAG TPA: hypothetical protein VK178_08155 [Opitutaceae bacterium]|nr:hypothetical protein [Opitutaceae bacterium]
MPSVVTTLFEGDYHYGVAALANSLARNGYTGRLWTAYRGALPTWADVAPAADGTRHIAAGSVEIVLFPHPTDIHFTHYKPWWMQEVLDTHEPGADAVFYFDPDIVVCSRWSYYEEWAGYGIALCEDNHYHVGPHHPLRHAWAKFARERGREVVHTLHRFCNGGFQGVRREHRSFLSDWAELVQAVEPESGSLKGWRSLDRTHRFWSANQDTMNLAAMITPHPVAIYGPNGMDFLPSAGRPMMSHAVDKPKPWKKRYVLEALRGQPPSRPDRWFWEYADGPLPLFPAATVRARRRAIKLGALLGRFYRRS